jgi:hypothetical protein
MCARILVGDVVQRQLAGERITNHFFELGVVNRNSSG